MKESAKASKRHGKPSTFIAIVLFAVIAVLHMLRLLLGWEVILAGLTIPMWASVPGIAATAGLAAHDDFGKSLSRFAHRKHQGMQMFLFG